MFKQYLLIESMTKRIRTTDIVKVNVGGERFDIALQTTKSFGYLCARLNDGFISEVDKDGYMFIDRDPYLFRILLQSVRTYSRPLQNVINNHKQCLLSECAFFCVDNWLIDAINGHIGGFFMRIEDREIRFLETSIDVETLDPFAIDFSSKLAIELGPVLLQKSNRACITCGHVGTLKERLDMLTKGLVTELASVDGLLLAGGCIVNALVAQPSSDIKNCTDVDIFLRCSPMEGIQKVKDVYNAMRKISNSINQNGSMKNLFVTRTSGSITFFITDKSYPPIQVVIYIYIYVLCVVYLNICFFL